MKKLIIFTFLSLLLAGCSAENTADNKPDISVSFYAVENFAKEIAQKENCYKVMLLTGSKKESTLNFYERAGYNRNDKTAFIQWI